MTSIERLAHGLCLAAAPSFACMALISAVSLGLGSELGIGATMICSASSNGSGSSGSFDLHGMTAMYALMAVFHLPPWLRFGQRATFQAS